VVVQQRSINSAKKGAHWRPSNEGERARKTRAAHSTLTHRSPYLVLLSRWGINRHGVGEGESELGADFTSLYLPL
jgi:hypothetical protein